MFNADKYYVFIIISLKKLFVNRIMECFFDIGMNIVK